VFLIVSPPVDRIGPLVQPDCLMLLRLAPLALFLVCSLAASVFAQDAETVAPPDPASSVLIKVYLDCRSCDMTFLRQEIQYLNYVTDPHVADVHVLVTTRTTAGDGREYTIQYIGQGRFAGRNQKIVYASSGTDTDDERRHGFARVFGLGLTGYLVQTPMLDHLSLDFQDGEHPQATEPGQDPWNFWIFRLSGSAQVNAERASQSRRYRGSISASRTTEDWKTSVSVNGSFNTSVYTLSDGSELTSHSNNWSARNLIVRSLGRTHWAVAFRAQVGASTSTNYDLNSRVAAGIEYSFFPYAESSNRSMVLQYTIGDNYFDYSKRTIYGKTTESAGDQAIVYGLAFRQPWGSTNVTLEAANYLGDFSKHRLDVNGRIDVRLFRGLTLNLDGSASSVHDQLYLPAGQATDEEILLKIRQLQTSFRYSFQVGFSYQFGSIFNNVVNPRFDGR
jgi:hypothetical protein